MNIDALKYMVEMLKGIKESGKKFDLVEWVILDEENPVCGTSCCAMGYAALDPVFQAAGLKMFASNPNDINRPPILLKTAKDFNKVVKDYEDEYTEFDFSYKSNIIREGGFRVANKLFDFEHEETSEILFSKWHYDALPGNGSIDEVIERIEELIQKGEENFVADYNGHND